MALKTSEPIIPKENELSLRQAEEFFVRIMNAFLKKKEREILAALEEYNRGRVVCKAFTDENILGDLVGLLSVKVLKDRVYSIIKNIIGRAMESAEHDLNVNVPRDPYYVQTVQEAAFMKVKGLSDDLIMELQNQLIEGWQNGEGIRELKERVKSVWSNGNLTDARAETIARTESLSAYNGSRLLAAKRSGIKAKKRWNAFYDGRTGEDSKKLDGQVRELDEDFYDVVNDKYIPNPPNRPNCRCRMDVIPE